LAVWVAACRLWLAATSVTSGAAAGVPRGLFSRHPLLVGRYIERPRLSATGGPTDAKPGSHTRNKRLKVRVVPIKTFLEFHANAVVKDLRNHHVIPYVNSIETKFVDIKGLRCLYQI